MSAEVSIHVYKPFLQSSDPRPQPADWDDPGHLVESAFRGLQFTDEEADTILLAWFAMLPHGVEPPVAASSLLDRLTVPVTSQRLERQHRIVELLRVVARCRPAAGGVPVQRSFHQN